MKPSLQQLYSIEQEVETAFLRVIEDAVAASDLSRTHRVYLEFSDQEKKTPFIELHLTGVKPDHEVTPVINPDGREDYYRWAAILVIRYCTSRGANSGDQATLVGWLRARTLSILGGGLDMPNHFIVQIMPDVTPRLHDSEFDLDISELQFPIIIEVKPGLF